MQSATRSRSSNASAIFVHYPTSVAAASSPGRAYASAGKTKAAAAQLKQARELDPDDRRARAVLKSAANVTTDPRHARLVTPHQSLVGVTSGGRFETSVTFLTQ
jgi:hypothetical protein